MHLHLYLKTRKIESICVVAIKKSVRWNLENIWPDLGRHVSLLYASLLANTAIPFEFVAASGSVAFRFVLCDEGGCQRHTICP